MNKVEAAMNSEEQLERITNLRSIIDQVSPLQKSYIKCKSLDEKRAFLSKLAPAELFLSNHPEVLAFDIKEQIVLLQLAIVGATDDLFESVTIDNKDPEISSLLQTLITNDQFYDYMGGLLGYHVKTVELILAQLTNHIEIDDTEIEKVPFVDIRKDSKEVSHFVFKGISGLDKMAEVYVAGGAGDRLKLEDPETKMPLPVACLNFLGRPLLSGLFRDLEAREHLYFKLFGKSIQTPVVMMTSHDKDNDTHIQEILEQNNYFGRSQKRIFRIVQPLCPVVCIDGKWGIKKRNQLFLKPGGHGVIWKLAKDSGAFDWLETFHRDHILVRQINNPVAGLDYGLAALTGYGLEKDKAFGFESCPRKEGMSEGMNVLRSKKLGNNQMQASISNVEYTEFAKRKENNPGFAEKAEGGDFPTNTNILFADCKKLLDAVDKAPVPGLIVNMKHPVDTIRKSGVKTLPAARLESTMQNIADEMTDVISCDSDYKEALSTFVLVNDRARTISVTKKAFDGKDALETPEGCFYDYNKENVSMLQKHAEFLVPEMNSLDAFLQSGPSALFIYHPALGPFYSIIGQKIQKGQLKENSELQIEAQEVYIRDLTVDGSLLLEAENVTGYQDDETGLKSYSNDVGSISFENVTVINKGIDRSSQSQFWKNKIVRKEACRIILEGHSECVAKNVTISGDFTLRVPDKKRAILSQREDGKVAVCFEPLENQKLYRYLLDGDEVILSR